MKNIISIISITLLTVTMLIAQHADDIIGSYRLPNGLDVEIYKSNDKYQGKIIYINSDISKQILDTKNPEKSLRNDSLLNKIIITDLEFDPNNKIWNKGRMYGPEKGMIFNLKINEIREKEIEVVGSKFIFWKTMVWLKI